MIGAAINPNLRRDLGPMNPTRSAFGSDIDYGRLVNDIRRNRDQLRWWVDQREVLTARDRAVWIYALIAVAGQTVVESCLTLLNTDIDALESDDLASLMASSSRLGLAGISRRLTCDLAVAALELSVPLGLLITHHTDIMKDASSLASAFTSEVAVAAARYGPAGWPALRIAGIALCDTESHLPDEQTREWLAVLKAHGPDAAGGVALGPMPESQCEQILADPARYPTQWITIAEASRSRRNAEPPLLASADTWFGD